MVIDVNNVCLQQDGGTYHTSQATIDLLCQTFDDCCFQFLQKVFIYLSITILTPSK